MSYLVIQPNEATRVEVEETIQAWRDQRAIRLAKEQEADQLKKSETDMKSWLIEVFKAQQYEGMVINQRITGLSTKEVYTVLDKEAVTDYIYENQALDLLEFRISQRAIQEREDVGEIVPGLDLVETYDLFDRKA